MSEIGLARAQAVQFEISDFDFEMQDSSNFKISSYLTVYTSNWGLAGGVVGSAAAEFPPFTSPRFSGFFKGWILELLGWIARNCVEPPQFFAGVGIEGGEIAS